MNSRVLSSYFCVYLIRERQTVRRREKKKRRIDATEDTSDQFCENRQTYEQMYSIFETFWRYVRHLTSKRYYCIRMSGA